MELYSNRAKCIEYSIREIETLAQKYLSDDMIFLNIGDPVRMGIRTPGEVIRAGVNALRTGYNAYSKSQGSDESRKSIMKYYARHGIDISPENVFITMGVSEGISILYSSLFNPGDSVVLPRPYYPIYNEYSKLNNIRTTYYEFDEDGFPDLESLKRSINDRTKSVVLINPNNPYGTTLSRKQINSFINEVLSRNLLLICDEIYSELVYRGHMEYALKNREDERIVVFNGLSKSFRVPGWRIGWAVFGAHQSLDILKSNFLKLQQLRLSSPTPFEHALISIVNSRRISFDGYLDHLKKNADTVYKLINDISGLSVNRIDAAFYAFVRLNKRTPSESFAKELIQKKHVVVVPGTGFGKEGYFRIVFAGDSDKLKEAIERIGSLF